MENTNLVELIKNTFNDTTLNHIAIQLQEKKEAVEQALAGLIPAVLLQLETKITSSESALLGSIVPNAQAIINHSSHLSEGIRQAFSNEADPNGLFLVEKADSLLNELLGNRKDTVNKVVAKFSGLKPSSCLRLLSITAPAAVLCLYNKSTPANQATSQSFLLQLAYQKEDIINQVPSGLHLSGPLGLNNPSNVDQESKTPIVSDNEPKSEPHRVTLFQWIIIFVLAGSILTGFYLGCGSNRAGVTMELPPAGTVDNGTTNP